MSKARRNRNKRRRNHRSTVAWHRKRAGFRGPYGIRELPMPGDE